MEPPAFAETAHAPTLRLSGNQRARLSCGIQLENESMRQSHVEPGIREDGRQAEAI
jgi:hypothetical protein